MEITIGCDPEVFVKDRNGEFVSAHGMIPGTKQNPHRVPCGAVQVDGNALEFNIDPASTANQFVTNIKTVYAQLRQMVPGFNLAIEPTAVFDKAYWDRLPDAAKELGCDPDFCAWDGKVNDRPKTDEPFRTAAGHIHIGWYPEGEYVDVGDYSHFEDCCTVAQQLDCYVGVFSTMWDTDQKRRSLYGKAGCFRPKPYGIEYRTLSNAWLKSEELMVWVFNQTQKAMDDLENGTLGTKYVGALSQTIINTGNSKFLKHYNWKSIPFSPVPGTPAARPCPTTPSSFQTNYNDYIARLYCS